MNRAGRAQTPSFVQQAVPWPCGPYDHAVKRWLLAVLLATVWIGANEFLRNQVLFIKLWVHHYLALGLQFPADAANGAVWGIWSLVFASVIATITRRFNFAESLALAWVVGFVMMWLVIGNLGVLPFGMLWFAVPLSLLEAAGAVYICTRIHPPDLPEPRR